MGICAVPGCLRFPFYTKEEVKTRNVAQSGESFRSLAPFPLLRCDQNAPRPATGFVEPGDTRT